jgi:Colon cancer-associated protein Mic1-like
LCRNSPYKLFKLRLDNSRVIGFNFIIQSNCECAYFVVTVKGLILYKLSASSWKLKVIKNIQINVFDFCYEPFEGVLALVSGMDKISLFYLHQPKGSKLYQGPTFNVLTDRALNTYISTGPKACNLLKFVTRLDWNQLQIFKIYDLLYLVHVDNLVGYIYFFKLIPDTLPKVFATYKIPQGIYSLGISENLVIIQSYNSQETLIYDIQSQLQEYLIKVSHANLTKPTTNRMSAEFSIQIDLTSDFYFVADEVIIDLKTSSFKTYVLNPASLIENHPDDVKIIMFLLRRDNCKMKVLEKIKESLLTYTPLKKLEIIFSTLAVAYSIAKTDKNVTGTRKYSDNIEHLEISYSEIDPRQEVKTESGVTVLMQSDIYFCVFAPVYKHIENQKYFAEALFSFLYHLIESKVVVHFSLQYLLFKALIKIKEFTRVQKLVENKFFTDSEDIALFLTSIGKSESIKYFPNAFVLGIDMLHRLKLYNVMITELAEQDYYYESLFISKNNKIPVDAIQNIIKKCEFEYE